jgi:tripartite-type tricarboxylate transporter receptor subunit TctC
MMKRMKNTFLSTTSPDLLSEVLYKKSLKKSLKILPKMLSKIQTNSWLSSACLCGILLLSANASVAQNAAWPNKTIKFVVPFAPGSFTDTAARLVGAEITKHTQAPVIIENKGGAGGTLGADTVAKSSPDGYTFLVTDNSFAVSTALYDKLPYQPFTDLIPVSIIAEAPAILVGQLNLPQKNLKAIVQSAQNNSNLYSFGSGGIGSSAHLGMEQFLTQNDIKMTHVPFKGIASAIVDVVAGRIDFAIGSAGSTAPFIQDGKLLAIAVSGNQRLPILPQVPTFAESGFANYKMTYWFGLLAPRGTPPAVIEKMYQEIKNAVQTPQVNDVFKKAGAFPSASTPAEFTKVIKEDSAMWSDLITKKGLKTSIN